MAKKKEQRLNHEEFVRKAIVSLRSKNYKGIHSIYSGFNSAFNKYFPKDDVVTVTRKLAEDGKIVLVARKGKRGVMLYLPEDAANNNADSALNKILS